MDKIEINEENYREYQAFLDAKNLRTTIYHPIIFGTIVAVSVGTALFGFVAGLVAVILLANAITETVSVSLIGAIIYIGGFAFSLLKILPNVLRKAFIKSFRKKYPAFDINLDEKEVEKELEKYHQLSKIPKDIEIQKKGHLETQNESFRKMSVEERLECLKQEQEFWKQVAIQEKYKDTEEDTTGQVGIGQIKSPENEEKVKHI